MNFAKELAELFIKYQKSPEDLIKLARNLENVAQRQKKDEVYEYSRKGGLLQ